MLTRRLLLILLTCSQLLTILNAAKGQDHQKRASEKLIDCSITVESSFWSRGKPASIVIRLENTSGKELAFWASYYVYLTNTLPGHNEARSLLHLDGITAVGEGYWSPAGMTAKDGKLLLVPKDDRQAIVIKHTKKQTISEFPNDEIHLGKGEVREARVDLAQFSWEDRARSVWPGRPLFDSVPAGQYTLEFEIALKAQRINSNPVAIAIE